MARLHSDDLDSQDSAVYSLVDGPGSFDNGLFQLVGDELFLNDSPDYEQRQDYRFRLRHTDLTGGFIEEAFVLPVVDFIERSFPLDLQQQAVVPFSPSVGGRFALHVPAEPELSSFDSFDLELVFDPAFVSFAGAGTNVLHFSSLPWTHDAAGAGQHLLAVEFDAVNQRFDAVTGEPTSSLLQYQGRSPQDSAVLFQGSALLTAFNLDVDGDGLVRPFSDGLMLIRKLLGPAFAGEALTDKALPHAATRSTAEIHAFIEAGISSGDLDLDGDGRVSAFGDGLMLIRSLLGFRGEDLIDKALSASSPWAEQPDADELVQQAIQGLVAPAHRDGF